MLGLASLDAAFALLVLVAAHPPPRPPEIRFALSVPPRAPAPAPPPVSVPTRIVEAPAAPREVVVAIGRAPSAASSAAPRPVAAVAPPAPAYSIEVPIGVPTPRAIDLANLTEAAAPTRPTARVDALVPPPPVALARIGDETAGPAMRVASAADRIGDRVGATPSGVLVSALGDVPHALVRGVDRLLPRPAALSSTPHVPRMIARGDASDRLIPSTVTLVRERDAPAPRRVAWLGADRLTPGPARRPLRDEVAWSTSPRVWSSAPQRDELSPATRLSPAVLLARLLPELGATPRTTGLKSEFVSLLLPLVMRVNEQILRERERVVALAPAIDAGLELLPSDEHAAAGALQAAGLEGWDTSELLLRLDAVPLSMALAQAAQESGWGRSRPAREDNALFGQTEFMRGGRSRVQSFDDLLETVNAYAHNLNTHRAYAEFRRRRAALRARGDKLDGPALVAFIPRYSERGPRYVEAIRNVMRINNLSVLDATMLDAALDGAVSTLDGVALDRPTLDRAALDRAALDPAMLGPFLGAAPLQGMDN